MAKKQAVLLIHGIGDQKPMQTLRGFVDAVWTRNDVIHNKYAGNSVWSRPDTVSESYELRQLTTPQNAAGITTDFFEFYWAHLMQGTTYAHVVAWARSLLLRKPSTVPQHLKPVYWLLIVLLVLAAGLAIYTVVRFGDKDKLLPTWASTLITLLLLPALAFVVRGVVGDAARYLHVAPTNVQSRHAIRHAGVSLLKALHQRGYQRIIVVGHSLGSVIGYDIITYAWVGYHNRAPEGHPPSMEALFELEAIATADSAPEITAVQVAQRKYFNELVANGNEWRVTDFITLGSPLAHAAILLANDAHELEQRHRDREFPICLPTLETLKRSGKTVRRFSYGANDDIRVPHHAAAFAPTRWTNLYFPCRWIFLGDLVGGEISPVFGAGVRDIAVSTNLRGGFLSHTLYWSCPDSREVLSHIESLREALDLTDTVNA
jgi:hypothetical protein